MMVLSLAGRGNYLRMRGEYIATTSAKMRIVELPPHARRIQAGVL